LCSAIGLLYLAYVQCWMSLPCISITSRVLSVRALCICFVCSLDFDCHVSALD
jgi:hypothetical protein